MLSYMQNELFESHFMPALYVNPAAGARSRRSRNLLITELFSSRILNMDRSSLHTRRFRLVQLCQALIHTGFHRLTEIGQILQNVLGTQEVDLKIPKYYLGEHAWTPLEAFAFGAFLKIGHHLY